jgi:hypothetical protein
MFENSDPRIEEDPMIRFLIFYKRDKGPQTPNFRKLSKLLHSDTAIKKPVNRGNIILKHGGVGIKMNFVCDILEKLRRLVGEVKAWRDGKVVYIKKKEYYDFIFNLDIFIFELYSTLDYFALEIAEILKLRKKMKDKMVNIRYFTDLKRAVNLDQKIRQKLNIFEKQLWFNYFHNMRIRVVHRLPVSLMSLLYGETIEFPFLPDDPLNVQSVSQKKLDPLVECKKWLEGVFDFIDTICGDLGKELFDNF